MRKASKCDIPHTLVLLVIYCCEAMLPQTE